MTTNATLAHEATRASVTFWGAAQQVTGSMHLLEAGDQKFLLDCGLYQGTREESRRRNARLPFDASTVEAVLVSHAHIDHCGNFPTLVKNGFDGPIYTTPASKDLLRVMLIDSAKIQEEDAAYLNIQKHQSEPVVQPLVQPRRCRTGLAAMRRRALRKISAVDPGHPLQVRRGRPRPRLGDGSLDRSR